MLSAAKVTKLENGIRVITENEPHSHMAHFGIYISGGSKVAEHSWAPAFMEKMAYRATPFRSSYKLIRNLNGLGYVGRYSASREYSAYHGSVLKSNLDEAFGLVSESVANQKLNYHEIQESIKLMEFELAQRDSQSYLPQLVHETAFNGYPLANRTLPTPEELKKVDALVLYEYLDNAINPENLVFSATGVDHDHFVTLVQSHWAHGRISYKESDQIVETHYVGGTNSMRLNEAPENAIVSVGVETPSFKDKNFIASLLIRTMLGGGEGFSVGGPGKGMLSRLSLAFNSGQVPVEQLSSTCDVYADTGVLSVVAHAREDLAANTEKYLLDTIENFNTFSEEEIERAKAILTSQTLLNLENREIRTEEMAKSLLVVGDYTQPEELVAKAMGVTKKDIDETVNGMLKSKRTVVTIRH